MHGQPPGAPNWLETARFAVGAFLALAYDGAMHSESDEIAALQRLMLMFVPESERAAFMASALALMAPPPPMSRQPDARSSAPDAARRILRPS